MVICTGSGPLMVYVDADGNPVQAPHICPDCVLNLLAAIAPQGLHVERASSWGLLRGVDASRAGLAVLAPVPSARAPPFVL